MRTGRRILANNESRAEPSVQQHFGDTVVDVLRSHRVDAAFVDDLQVPHFCRLSTGNDIYPVRIQHRGHAIGLVSIVHAYNISALPLADEAIAVMNSEWGQNWAKASEKNGTIVLATGACGFRNLTNSKRVVKTPADLNGIKLRVPSWEVTIKTMEALGVSCTSIAYNETYQALKTGVADGQENPWAYIVSPKFYEVQKYATVLNWNLTLEYFPINKAWFDALPADYQKIVKDAATSAMEWFNQANKDAEKGYIDLCAQYMEITELTPEEHQAFVDATASVYDYYIQKGLFTQQDLDTVRGIIAASKK